MDNWDLRWNYMALLYCIRTGRGVMEGQKRYELIDKEKDTNDHIYGTPRIRPWEN